MSARIKHYLPALKRLHRMTDKAKRDYIKVCDREIIDCIAECSKNVLKGNVPLNDAQMRKLRPRREDVRALATKKTSVTKKRKILQKGGFLTALLGPALSILAGLLLK